MVICFRCLHGYQRGKGKFIKHPKLKDLVEVFPVCKCWWVWTEPNKQITGEKNV